MKNLFVVIYQDDGDLVYEPVAYADIVRFFGTKNSYFNWGFVYENHQINVYSAALSSIPIHEEREEMEQRILAALNLI